ncbi:SHOCT domain-containing protein [Clostridium beijerinckii]|uniref:SHOCT domain-containing protein n=1 Tax=Clostridium beijerinckii TaxID=1520 RepID=A0A1S9N456_CLOBE|nr:SHOCT domain-containing protein [Clostridium beijerinckii]MZK51455.1 SHOCT domain-containing protein [Clostridium beijerinckii]MZK59655.1 SHOCT domain-containing protein [Clostridium beijerinckii]MZK69775.1 SHOCT domain-containing protein [Clostridium beijerinckii]MZK75153.1 SHOCT domain-containing protein [Clostridium beijerinckii]MZK84865.1 SHOCT domain-containing protein [Clostridium beijerinckii]
MNKILQFVFRSLEIICWIWIVLCLVISFTAKTVTGMSIISSGFLGGVFPVLIIITPAVAFLIWRFNSEKGIREQIKNEKQAKYLAKLKEEKINEQNKKLSEETIEKLMNLKELLSLEIITKEEFEKKKNDLLS